MKYIAKTQTLTVTSNTTFPPEEFGGWSAVNTGNVPAIVDGMLLDPAGALAGVDYTTLSPNVVWGKAITIRFTSSTGNKQVILTRLKYSEYKEEEDKKKKEEQQYKNQ